VACPGTRSQTRQGLGRTGHGLTQGKCAWKRKGRTKRVKGLKGKNQFRRKLRNRQESKKPYDLIVGLLKLRRAFLRGNDAVIHHTYIVGQRHLVYYHGDVPCGSQFHRALKEIPQGAFEELIVGTDAVSRDRFSI